MQLIMLKFIALTALFCGVLATCASQCKTCLTDSNPYACSTCPIDSYGRYLWSCPYEDANLQPLFAVAVGISVIYFFSLTMGMGVYRELFESIQLATLVSWRYGFESFTVSLQATNLAVIKSNNFIETFGVQFLIVMCVLGCFWFVLALMDRSPHSPTAMLVRRKKIIFPVRICTLIFNILLYSSIAQLATNNSETTQKVFPLVMAAIGLTSVVGILIGLAVVSNWSKFQVDDPHYYPLVEQMISKKWYAKNSIIFSLLTRAAIICIFVGFFSVPQTSGIIILIIQVMYSLYMIVMIRYTKIRYYSVIVTSQILMVGFFLIVYVGSTSSIGSDSWKGFSQAYIGILLALVILFFLASVFEIIINREVIIKQLKSIYSRFIRCEKLEDKIIVSKYDQNSHR